MYAALSINSKQSDILLEMLSNILIHYLLINSLIVESSKNFSKYFLAFFLIASMPLPYINMVASIPPHK